MNHRIIARIISTVIFGLVLGLALHHQYVSRGLMGREEFMTQQAARFDLYYAHPAPLIFECFTGVFFITGLFVAYEAAAFGISRILDAVARNNAKPPPVS